MVTEHPDGSPFLTVAPNVSVNYVVYCGADGHFDKLSPVPGHAVILLLLLCSGT